MPLVFPVDRNLCLRLRGWDLPRQIIGQYETPLLAPGVNGFAHSGKARLARGFLGLKFQPATTITLRSTE